MLQFTKQRREGGSGAGACVVLGLLAKLPDHRTMYLPTLREGRGEREEGGREERRRKVREGGEEEKGEGRDRSGKEGREGKGVRKER